MNKPRAAKLSVPDTHRKRIALSTLRMTDVGARVMGGMTKDEAERFLKSIGYSDKHVKILRGVS